MVLVLAAAPGCVTRKLFIKSEPPGASVLLDGKLVGTTPYGTEFLSYGTRRLELRHEGYVRQVQELDVWRPWWQSFPIAVFADVIWPFEILDERRFEFTLTPLDEVQFDWSDADSAYQRLRALRRRSGLDPDPDAPPASPPDAPGS